ncbi:MAG TPA: type II toxin-antitoxin system RelE/ParE family toxin [Phycisphaerae bacterium]|jgi:plasmid stabilization system protein ParE|nr:type II toxin-antitoxin system RelE/ParE family toxin [Phycisphaerae bacterium]HOB76278.1 type II toxin-antitoxin system RelE/ParE family toxin [Phycisphaerae bacterium]HOJ53672.1 type II toxin-antitoxin system RelE/ParE family toxin [Phycisphaerae bacterium]HOL26397.1 type II toxin-antitoxin system RelE/ParE family toxin [Phycisphaerae bacterium]HPP21095.1 type II toxin-antitoxin system RelE/ParE family toxin [Phycisphaerae bacterium]
MSYSFHPEAEVEFLQAIDYYEHCRENLGYEFAVEVYAAVERIVAHPRAWPVLDGEVRRCQTARFPYGVLYVEEGGEILILAVMHLHRAPDYWKHRLD